MARRKRQEFAVIGLGRFGSSVAHKLESYGHTVLAVDIKPEPVQRIASSVTQAATLDATNEQALREVDIEAFDTVIVAIGQDFEASLLATVALKSVGVRRVICKATTNRQREILERVGADRVIQPEQSAGIQLAQELSAPAMLDHIPLGPSHSLAEIVVPAQFAWQSLAQCDLRRQYEVTVLLIKRGDELFVSPGPDTILQEDDVLVVLGTNADIETFSGMA